MKTPWRHPRADFTIMELQTDKPVGIFGRYKSLILEFEKTLPENITIYAQDLSAGFSFDITKNVLIQEHRIKLSGALIDTVGTSSNNNGDISAPGLVLRIYPG
ncbi:MAG: hypothetical protein MI975_19410 [Cytophagales bacterium]|nr:hypothetical protein [Cytophagales bacterium]